MKFRSISIIAITLFCMTSSAFAIKGVVATDEDITRLKRDVLKGNIHIGKTRLMFVQSEYGEASDINDDNRRITYDYGDLRIIFERKRILRSWDYDSFRDPIYTNAVDDLRFDLEAKEIVGDNITYETFVRGYGDPTESMETDNDGGHSVYYYGDIMLKFENVISVRSWRGSNLGESVEEQILGSIPEEAPATEPVEELATE